MSASDRRHEKDRDEHDDPSRGYQAHGRERHPLDDHRRLPLIVLPWNRLRPPVLRRLNLWVLAASGLYVVAILVAFVAFGVRCRMTPPTDPRTPLPHLAIRTNRAIIHTAGAGPPEFDPELAAVRPPPARCPMSVPDDQLQPTHPEAIPPQHDRQDHTDQDHVPGHHPPRSHDVHPPAPSHQDPLAPNGGRSPGLGPPAVERLNGWVVVVGSLWTAVLAVYLFLPDGSTASLLPSDPCSGLTAFLLLNAPFVLAPFVIHRAHRRLQRDFAACHGCMCTGCGHTLQGLGDTGTCPECGSGFDLERDRTEWWRGGVKPSRLKQSGANQCIRSI